MTGADTSRAWRELSAAALAHNVSVLRGALPPGCELMAVVKADAYGHSASAIVPQLLSLGVRSFAAATPTRVRSSARSAQRGRYSFSAAHRRNAPGSLPVSALRRPWPTLRTLKR